MASTDTYTVRIYGDDPQAGPNALLEEHDFASETAARQFAADASRDGDTLVTFNAPAVGRFAVLAPARGWIWTYSDVTRAQAQAVAIMLTAGSDVEWVVERIG